LFTYITSKGCKEAKSVNTGEYLGLIMTLMYLARLTRPDILLAVTYLATRSHQANDVDVRHVYRIISYLEATQNDGVTIHCTDLQIHVLCDASFAVHADGRGHTGFIVGMGESCSYIHARSGKQKLASLSSTDAEVIGMIEALKMSVWLRNLLTELNLTPLTPMVLWQDNKSAIIMVVEPSKCKRSKHILTKIMFARGLVLSGALVVKYLDTDNMTADVVTKPLHGVRYVRHTDKLMGKQWSDKVVSYTVFISRGCVG
jgi:hypothetical protein